MSRKEKIKQQIVYIQENEDKFNCPHLMIEWLESLLK